MNIGAPQHERSEPYDDPAEVVPVEPAEAPQPVEPAEPVPA